MPQLDQLRAEEVGGEHAGQENDEQREQRAEAGDVDAEPVLGLQRRRQQQQRLVEHVDHQLQHPDGDDQRDPDQQPGDEIFLQWK